MKNRIKNFITRLLWSSIEKIVSSILEDQLQPAILFFVGDNLIECKNMFSVPIVGDIVHITKKGKDVIFKVESREIISPCGYEIRLHGNLI